MSKCSLSLKLLCIALAVGYANNNPACAQRRWTVEIRPAVNFPIKTSGDARHPGFGIEGKTGFNLVPAVSTYIGWGWNLFPAGNSDGFSYEETGFTCGLQYKFRDQPARLQYFVGAGGVYNHIETENHDRELVTDSGHRLGWQIESGVILRLSEKLQIKPGIRYRNLQAAGLQYIAVGTGFSF